ncbi:MAG: hypothetical protein ACREC3_14205 [Methyloceanibacter sp.]
MSVAVADRSSNKNEQIEQAAELIGRSKTRARIFRAIYTGKRRVKTIDELMAATGLARIAALDAGRALHAADLVHQTRVDSRTAYEKIPFFQQHRDRILRLAGDPVARASLPTKRGPHVGTRPVHLSIRLSTPRKTLKARRVSIDDIGSFSRVKQRLDSPPFVKMPETRFKHGVAKVLGERGDFKDWGGELRDLSSTRLVLDGGRRSAAIAFKGPGTSGRLTPAKMGKNGDQILRLARCPAEVFLVQYWGQIDDAILEHLEKLIHLKSVLEGRKLWYGIVDGTDSARLIRAYPQAFGVAN